MKMRTFIQLCNDSELLKKSVVIFTAAEYQVLFFATLLDRLKQKTTPAPKSLSYVEASAASLQAQLSTTFLGQHDVIWCGNISALEASLKKSMFGFLSTYEGPHALYAFISEKDLPETFDKQQVINLNDPLSLAEREQLIALLFDRLEWKHLFELTQETYKTMSLDTLVLFAQYRLVLGKNIQPFMQTWFEKIVAPDESLFTLAQWFFARKPQHFYRTWQILKDAYDPVFWTTFWSEQVWRAYYTVSFCKAQELAQAKQMAYKLPFSFLQRDWKQFSEGELLRAHDFLTTADFRIKNGASDLFLDLFFNNFFSRRF